MTPRPGCSKVFSKIKPNFRHCFFFFFKEHVTYKLTNYCCAFSLRSSNVNTKNVTLRNEYEGKYKKLKKKFYLGLVVLIYLSGTEPKKRKQLHLLKLYM